MARDNVQGLDVATKVNQTPFQAHETNQSTWFGYNNWSHHASQWLKGGAMVLGTALVGGLTYTLGKRFSGMGYGNNVPIASDGTATSSNDGAITKSTPMDREIDRGIMFAATKAVVTLPNRELLSLSEAKHKPQQHSLIQSFPTSKVEAALSQSQLKKFTNDLALDYPAVKSEDTESSQKQNRDTPPEILIYDFTGASYYGYSFGNIARLTDNSFVTTWKVSYTFGGSEAGNYYVYAQSLNAAGIKQGSQITVYDANAASSKTFSGGGTPAVSSLMGGGYVIVYSSDVEYHVYSYSSGVFGKRYNASGGQVGSFHANTSTTGEQANPQVAGLSNGGFVVIWEGAGAGDATGIFGQLYDASGVAQGGEFRANTYVTNSQVKAKVAGLSDGGFIVAWASDGQDLSSYGIYGQRYNAAGVKQGSEFRVNTYTANSQSYPAIVGLNDGGFVVVWASDGQDLSSYGIYGQRYDMNGVAQGGEFRVNSYTADAQYTPNIASLDDNGFVVTWASQFQDQFDFGVYAQAYDLHGVPQGNETRLNTYTDNDQITPAVTSFNGGGFIGAWGGVGPQNKKGVFAKTFITPQVINRNITAQEGQNFALTAAMLNAQDIDSDSSVVRLIISDWSHGQFEKAINPGIAISSFTQYQIDSNEIRFVHDGGEFAPAFNVTVTDGTTTAETFSGIINFTNVNDAPTLDAMATLALPTLDEDPIELPGIIVEDLIKNYVTDPDNTLGGIAITAVDNAHGLWEYSLDGSTWQSIAPVNNSASLLLDRANKVRFTPNPDYNGDANLTMRAWDKTSGVVGAMVSTILNGGSTAFSSATNSVWIIINSVNDAPVLSDTTTPKLSSIAEDTVNPAGNAVSNVVVGSIFDVDSISGPIAITAVDNTNGEWQYSILPDTWEAVAPVSDVTSLLLDRTAKVRFVPNSNFNGNAVFTFRAWDKTTGVAGTKEDTTINGNATAFSSEINTATIAVTPVNDPPTLGTVNVIIKEAEILPLTPMIMQGQDIDSRDNELIYEVSGVTQCQFERATNPGTAINIFTLQQLKYGEVHLVHNGSELAPSFNVTLSDGQYTTSPVMADIQFTNVNDAPLLDALAPLQLTAFDEDTSEPVGDTVASIIGTSCTDVDNAIGGIAITAVDNSSGFWQYSMDGTNWESIAQVGNGASLLLASEHKIRFIHNADFVGLSGVTFRAWDKTTGIVATRVNTIINGGTTAFSNTVNTAWVSVNSVNDAPVLSTTTNPKLISIAEDELNSVGTSVSTIVGGSISDVDSLTGPIAITAIDNTNGEWQYSLTADIWLPITAVSDIESLLLDRTNKIRFVPKANFNGNATFTFRAWDKTSGAVGAKADTTINGGATAFSCETNVATITVIPVNDPPSLKPVNVAIQEGQNLLVTSAMISAEDIDSSDSMLTFTVTDLEHCQFEKAINPGVPILTFTQQQIKSDEIRFVHNGDELAPIFKVSVSDGFSSRSAIIANIDFTNVNDAPTLNSAAELSLTAVPEDATEPAGDVVGTIVSSAITDPDSQVGAVAIIAADNSNGIWQYSLNGIDWLAIAPVSGTSSLLLGSANKIRFVPNPNFDGNASFTMRAWDKTSGTIGDKVDTSVNGESTAFSSISKSVTVAITPSNDLPVLDNNEITINKGEIVLITDKMLSAHDVDNAAAGLVFIISDLQHGRFELANAVNEAIFSFTQQQVLDKEVQLVHDNSDSSVSYKVAVSDGNLSTTPVATKINFINNRGGNANAESVPKEDSTIKDAIIGGSISGGLGIIFLVLKIYLGHKATQRLKKSTTDYKNSVECTQDEFDKNVLQPIAKELRGWVKITGMMGYISERTAQDYVAAVVKLVDRLDKEGVQTNLSLLSASEIKILLNEIGKQTRQTLLPKSGFCSLGHLTGFFKAEVSPADIEQHVDEIVDGVKNALPKFGVASGVNSITTKDSDLEMEEMVPNEILIEFGNNALEVR